MPDNAGMVGSADDVIATFRDTVLEGLPVQQADGGVLLVTGVPPDRVLEYWSAARQVVPVTRRWPVAVAPEWSVGFPSISDTRLVEIEAEALGMGDSRVFAPWFNDIPHPQRDWHHYLESNFPGAGLPAAMAAELPEPVLDGDVDHWIHERVTGSEPTVVTEDQARAHIGRQDWFEPDSVDLALLPTSSPWMAGAWLHYFGEVHRYTLIAALQHWNARWGAELVANWGTMLQFTVARRPQQGEEAWELAGQLLAWGGSLQMTQWQLAFVLTRIDTWLLHERP